MVFVVCLWFKVSYSLDKGIVISLCGLLTFWIINVGFEYLVCFSRWLKVKVATLFEIFVCVLAEILPSGPSKDKTATWLLNTWAGSVFKFLKLTLIVALFSVIFVVAIVDITLK